MADVHEQAGTSATTQARPADTTPVQPSEDEMRVAYEAELNRITSAEMIVQTAVSLINIGGRRLGLAPPASAGDSSAPAGGERDLEQVRDAIDGASALMPILERRMPRELGPLRDAIAQLQVAYAREAGGSAGTSTAAQAAPRPKQTQPQEPPGQTQPGAEPEKPTEGDKQPGPGPAQASGRLWVPGR